MPRFATIGYEGARLQDFVDCLRADGVDCLVDVRAVAFSRRTDFRHDALAAALLQAGIAYLHVPDLGNPEDGRKAAKAGDRSRYRAIFEAHLNGPPAQAALARMAQMAEARRICLMCYERDVERCHRGLVAGALEHSYGCEAKHLKVQRDLFGAS